MTPADAPVTLTAGAALTGSGSITSVQFYANGLLVGSDASSPYATTWTPTAAGAVQLTARAVASTGKVANAPPVPVAVTATGRVLGVSVSAPSNPLVGQSATVTVTGNGYACGAVHVAFGDGNGETFTLEVPLAATPLQTAHAWATAGTKTVTATGQGDCPGCRGSSGSKTNVTLKSLGLQTTGMQPPVFDAQRMGSGLTPADQACVTQNVAMGTRVDTPASPMV